MTCRATAEAICVSTVRRASRPCWSQWSSRVDAHSRFGDNMDKVRIDLTNEQQKKVRCATGQDAVAVESSVEELEDRTPPRGIRLSYRVEGKARVPCGRAFPAGHQLGAPPHAGRLRLVASERPRP